jgi:hypothetical protein
MAEDWNTSGEPVHSLHIRLALSVIGLVTVA